MTDPMQALVEAAAQRAAELMRDAPPPLIAPEHLARLMDIHEQKNWSKTLSDMRTKTSTGPRFTYVKGVGLRYIRDGENGVLDWLGKLDRLRCTGDLRKIS